MKKLLYMAGFPSKSVNPMVVYFFAFSPAGRFTNWCFLPMMLSTSYGTATDYISFPTCFIHYKTAIRVSKFGRNFHSIAITFANYPSFFIHLFSLRYLHSNTMSSSMSRYISQKFELVVQLRWFNSNKQPLLVLRMFYN